MDCIGSKHVMLNEKKPYVIMERHPNVQKCFVIMGRATDKLITKARSDRGKIEVTPDWRTRKVKVTTESQQDVLLLVIKDDATCSWDPLGLAATGLTEMALEAMMAP